MERIGAGARARASALNKGGGSGKQPPLLNSKPPGPHLSFLEQENVAGRCQEARRGLGVVQRRDRRSSRRQGSTGESEKP